MHLIIQSAFRYAITNVWFNLLLLIYILMNIVKNFTSVKFWLYVLIMSRTRYRVNPHYIGTPCLKQARNLKFKWLQRGSNPQPLSSFTNKVVVGSSPLAVTYQFSVKLDRCAGSCNIFNDLSNKVCIPNKTEDLNLSVFNISTGIKKSKILTKHISCKCKCKFDGKSWNSNQWWNNDKCRYECLKTSCMWKRLSLESCYM